MESCPKGISSVEISAQIRNYLQPAQTVLEMVANGKKVPPKLIKAALKDLDKVVNMLA